MPHLPRAAYILGMEPAAGCSMTSTFRTCHRPRVDSIGNAIDRPLPGAALHSFFASLNMARGTSMRTIVAICRALLEKLRQ